MNWFFLLLAFTIGMANTIQSGVNAQLRVALGNPIMAAITSFSLGLLVLLVAFPFFNQSPLPTPDTIRQISLWKFAGGFLGAFYVVTVIFIVKDIGPANLICLVIAGQMLAAMVIDHYGFQGFAVHPISLARIFGGILLIAGVYLILKN
jgi:transporter family-2 protein